MKVCPFIAFVQDGSPARAPERPVESEIAPPETDLDDDDEEFEGGGREKSAPAPIIELGYSGDGDTPPGGSARMGGFARTVRDRWAENPACLGSVCRFYDEDQETCGFELLLSERGGEETSVAAAVDLDPLESLFRERMEETRDQIQNELDKIWTFQKKSASEVIESLGDFSELKDEFLDQVKTQAEATNRLLESLQDEIQGEREKLKDEISGTINEARAKIGTLEEKIEDRMVEFEEFSYRVSDWQKDLGERMVKYEEASEKTAGVTQELSHTQDKMMRFIEKEKEVQEERDRDKRCQEAKILNNSGVHCYHNGDYAEALKNFERALELDPELTEAHNNMGLTYTEMDEEEEAIEAFRTAIALNPDLPATYNNLGYVFYLQGDYKQAIEMYNEALGRSTDSSSAYTNLGNAYYKLDKREKAIEAWKRALEIDPSNEKARRNLRRFQKVAG